MKLKKCFKIILFLLIVGAVAYFGYSYYNAILLKEQLEEERRIKEEATKKYEACLIEEFKESELTDELRESISNLNTHLRGKYNASVSYKDLVTGFKYSYKEDEVFYGASLIKLLGALYIYEKALEEELDLDEMIEDLVPFKEELDNFKDRVDMRYCMYSDNDHLIPLEILKKHANNIDGEHYFISGIGHMGKKSGLKELPEVIEIIRRA